MVNDKLETLEPEFETYCMIEFRGRLRRHPDLFPEAAVRDILEPPSITGVSPITMDDVTSGFNIGTNISLEPDFNEMVGFTEAEVRHLVETYRNLGVFSQDVDTAMGIMGEWYNGYRTGP